MGPGLRPTPEAGRENDIYRGFLDHPRADAALTSLAIAQHAVFHLSDLRRLGLSNRAIQHRAENGRLHRIHYGVYSLVPRKLLTLRGHWLAAVFACGPGAALSHLSAAVLHELLWYDGASSDVTVPGRGGHRHVGIRVHRSTTLTAGDVEVVNNIPCTTVARTLLDLGDSVSRRHHERAFDQAEISHQLSLTDVRDQIRRNHTRRAASCANRVLATHYIGRTPTWNDFEEAFLALTRRLGLPDPEVNAWIALNDGLPPIRPDFVWREQRVIVETDGHRFHRSRQKFEQERIQDQRATIAGWTPIRTTWRQLFNRPQELEPILLALINPR